jgi:hypothetical protein
MVNAALCRGVGGVGATDCRRRDRRGVGGVGATDCRRRDRRRRRGAFGGWLRTLPRWVHRAPYLCLLLFVGLLLVPGVVPLGVSCDSSAGAPAVRRTVFIHLSALVFGAIAELLLFSAVVASAQRRDSRPGMPTVAAACMLGLVAAVAAASPLGPLSSPVRVWMFAGVWGGIVTRGVTVVAPLAVAVIWWLNATGPRHLRTAQAAAWIVVLFVLPLIMAATYLAVDPVCFG